MSRVMFTISYSIAPEQRETYLKLIEEMKAQVVTLGWKEYAVYEAKGKKNHFTEIFVAGSIEEFDNIEESIDEKTQGLLQRLEELVDKDGMKYSTMVEVD
jgi:hypothetical protein